MPAGEQIADSPYSGNGVSKEFEISRIQPGTPFLPTYSGFGADESQPDHIQEQSTQIASADQHVFIGSRTVPKGRLGPVHRKMTY